MVCPGVHQKCGQKPPQVATADRDIASSTITTHISDPSPAAAITAPARHVRKQETLVWDLSEEGADAEVARALVDLVSQSALHLSTLRIAGNPAIGPEGATAIGRILGASASLTELQLGGCSLGAAGTQGLINNLSMNATLTTLALPANRLGPSGAAAISIVFGYAHSLTTLDLSHNELGVDGARELASGVTGSPALAHLLISANQLGDEGLAVLTAVAKTCSTLLHVDARWNGVSEAAKRTLIRDAAGEGCEWVL